MYPTTASLCGLEIPERIQGKDLSPTLDDPAREVREVAFSVDPRSKGNRGFLLRNDRWAFIQYAEDASQGIELFDMKNDPLQYANLAHEPKHQEVVEQFKTLLRDKLKEIRANDLAIKY